MAVRQVAVQAGQGAQQGALAGAAAAEQGDELAGRQLQVQPVEHRPLPVDAGQALDAGQLASVRRHDNALLSTIRTAASENRPSSPYRTRPTRMTSVCPYVRARSIM